MSSTFMLSHTQLAAMEEWAFYTHNNRTPDLLTKQFFLEARKLKLPNIPVYDYSSTLATIPEDYLVLYPEWCASNTLDASLHTSYASWLIDVDLLPCIADPAEYPGLCHFICMTHCGMHRMEDLTPAQQNSAQYLLNQFYEERSLEDFGLGGVYAGRWKIVATLTTGAGDCNRGIYRVKDKTTGAVRLMKVLASEALEPGYSAREIAVLDTLRGGCANIVQSCDSHTPASRREVAWLVMEMCNAQSLFHRADKYRRGSQDVPEMFVWHVFIGLLEALRYCHCGPGGGGWDPIYHRDIIMTNVLLHYPTDDRTGYPDVKLADFGCAVTRSEATYKQLKIADMPEVCPSAIPPEGALAAAATDMYQVGEIIKKLMEQEDKKSSSGRSLGKSVYSKKLRYLADCCAMKIASKRPDAASMLRIVQTSRDDLVAAGSIVYQELKA